VRLLGGLAFFIVVQFPMDLWAQSGTKGGVFVKRRPSPGLGEVDREIPGERPLLGIAGYDPVSVRVNQPVVGQPAWVSTFDSQQYRFASAENKKTFDSNPVRYAPVLSGWCLVTWHDDKLLKPGNPNQATIQDQRLYLFAGEKEKQAFLADPKKYVEADLLLGGLSPVSLVDQQQSIKGLATFETIFEGWRVRFVNDAERSKFQNNVGKYYPTFAGADPIALFQGQVRMGDPNLAFHYKNRLYLFANAENADKFRIEYKAYSDLDVAEQGICLVTLKERGVRQLGRYAITTMYLGRRFLFVSDDARKKFENNPQTYFQPK